MNTTANTLPATIVSAEKAEALPLHANPQAGDLVTIYSRGAWRVGQIVKVGRTNAQVAYTTPGGWAWAEKHAMQLRGFDAEAYRRKMEAYGRKTNHSDLAYLAEYTEREIAHWVEDQQTLAAEGVSAFVTVTTKTVKLADLRVAA